MKRSTKFFILTMAINIFLSILTVFNSWLKEVRVIDLVTFYATAFGAGASAAAVAVTFLKPKSPPGKETP